MAQKGSFPDQPPPYSSATPNTFHVQPQIVTVHPIPVGPEPQRITCPSCHGAILSDVKYETSQKTHLIALVLCVLFWPVACVPYCIDSCQNANHYCPQCGAYIGTYSS